PLDKSFNQLGGHPSNISPYKDGGCFSNKKQKDGAPHPPTMITRDKYMVTTILNTPTPITHEIVFIELHTSCLQETLRWYGVQDCQPWEPLYF
ncbi:Uncharacterized protein TCM_010931, partial [Theobroma cacao]